MCIALNRMKNGTSISTYIQMSIFCRDMAPVKSHSKQAWLRSALLSHQLSIVLSAPFTPSPLNFYIFNYLFLSIFLTQDSSIYAHYVFKAFDVNCTGAISFRVNIFILYGLKLLVKLFATQLMNNVNILGEMLINW